MASELKVDTISEKTSANGVTIDGVNLKDSAVKTDTISEYTSSGKINATHDIKLASGKKLLNSNSKEIGSYVKITSGSFSSADSLMVTDCFSTDFKHYMISLEYTGANGSVGGSANITEFRMSNSGTSYTSNHYQWGQKIMRFASASEFDLRAADTSYWRLNGYGTTSGNQHFHTIQMMNPAHVARTQFTSNCILDEVDQEHWIMQGGSITTTTAFDGFSLGVQGNGDFTGTYRVYGVS